MADDINNPQQERDDDDVRINEYVFHFAVHRYVLIYTILYSNRALLPITLVEAFQGLMGYGDANIGNAIFHVLFGWRGGVNCDATVQG